MNASVSDGEGLPIAFAVIDCRQHDVHVHHQRCSLADESAAAALHIRHVARSLLFEVDQRNDHLVGAFLSGRTDKPHGGESFGLAVQAGEVFLQTLGVICQDTFYHFLTFYIYDRTLSKARFLLCHLDYSMF